MIDASLIVGILGASAAVIMALSNVVKVRYERRTARMSISGERAVDTVETYHDGMLTVNSDGRIITANQRSRFITGYTSEELIGKHVNDLLPARFRIRHIEHMKRYRESPHTRLMGKSGQELFVLTKRGEEVRVLLSLTPREGIDNGPEITVGMRVMELDAPREERA